jgi:hypothetical protein
MAYLYYVVCHNLQPYKIDNEDPLFIFETFVFETFFICHMSLCKLLIFMVIYEWHTNNIWIVKYLLTIDFIHTCNLCNATKQFLVTNVFCN